MTRDAGKAFRDVRGNAPPFTVQRRDNFSDVGGVFVSQVGFTATVETTIIVGDRSDVDPGLLAASAGPIEFVRADVDERVGVAVVSVFEDEDIVAAGVCASNAQSEFVGFAAGIDEVADAERRGKKSREALGVTIGVVVEIARVGVQDSELVLHSANDARMRVTDEGNIVVDIEERAAGVVEEILFPAANDFQRMAVGDAEISAEEGAASGKGSVERRSGRRKMAGRNAYDEIGIGRQTEPDGALGGESYTGKIRGTIEKVENDLKMNMRRPAAIFPGVADVSKNLATGDVLANFQRRKRSGGEMAVKSEEVEAGGRGVAKYDDGAVIERRGIVCQRVDRGVERGGNGIAGCDEQIEAEMNGAALSEWIAGVAEHRRGVERTRFVVTADTD